MSSVTLVAHVSLSTIRHKDVSRITLHSESQWKMIIYWRMRTWLGILARTSTVMWHAYIYHSRYKQGKILETHSGRIQSLALIFRTRVPERDASYTTMSKEPKTYTQLHTPQAAIRSRSPPSQTGRSLGSVRLCNAEVQDPVHVRHAAGMVMNGQAK